METSDARILAFNEAIVAIAERAHALGRRAIVGVTGAVASGKSTFARRLVDHVEARGRASVRDRAFGVAILSTDHYLPDYDRTPEHLRDLPESSDLARLARDLAELRAGRATRVPQWSFDAHARVGERDVAPAEVVVVEGLHALHESVRTQVDVAVFVEAPRGLRLARAVAREKAGERPWPIEYLERFFVEVAEPTFALHAPRYRASADVIVRNEADVACLADVATGESTGSR